MTDPTEHTQTLASAGNGDAPAAHAGSAGQARQRATGDASVVLSGRYVLEERIASGGMASVWRARDQVLARTVAVKLLHDHLAADEGFRQRFRREAISAAKLTHPNVVGLYDTGRDGDRVWLVMEYVEGLTLRDLIANLGVLGIKQAATVGERVARALGYAHARGLVHRDVKPANILIGNDGAVKVADFGIAKAEESGEDLTKTGMVLGTAAYVAPEQILAEPIDGKTDQYGVGCCLYEALTGQRPFTGGSSMATAARRLQQDPPPLRSLRPDAPEALAGVVARAMARRPEDRFDSAADLADALARYADPVAGLGGGQADEITELVAAAGEGADTRLDPTVPVVGDPAHDRGPTDDGRREPVDHRPSDGAGTPADPHSTLVQGAHSGEEQGEGDSPHPRRRPPSDEPHPGGGQGDGDSPRPRRRPPSDEPPTGVGQGDRDGPHPPRRQRNDGGADPGAGPSHGDGPPHRRPRAGDGRGRDRQGRPGGAGAGATVRREGRRLVPVLTLLAAVGGLLGLGLAAGVLQFEAPLGAAPPTGASEALQEGVDDGLTPAGDDADSAADDAEVEEEPPEPVAISPADVSVFDPEGSGDENGDALPNLLDGDDATTWRTQRYNSADFGNLKSGVGFVLDLSEERELQSVTVRTETPGVGFDLRVADTPADAADQWELVGSVSDMPESADVTFDEPVTTRYLLVWITGPLQPREGRFLAEFSSLGLEGLAR